MSLMIIVAIKHWIINQLNLFVLIDLSLLHSNLIFFSVLLFPHGRRIRSLLLLHVLIHQPVSESVIRLFAKLLKILCWTSPV